MKRMRRYLDANRPIVMIFAPEGGEVKMNTYSIVYHTVAVRLREIDSPVMERHAMITGGLTDSSMALEGKGDQ